MGLEEELGIMFERDDELDLEKVYLMRETHHIDMCKKLPYFPYMGINSDAYDAEERSKNVYKKTLKIDLPPHIQKVVDEAVERLEGWETIPTQVDEKHVYWEFENRVKRKPREVLSTSELDLEAVIDNFERNLVLVAGYDRPGRWDSINRQSWLAKYKWPDGSIHYAYCDLSRRGFFEQDWWSCKVEPQMLGLFRKRKLSRILQETQTILLRVVQRKLDAYHNELQDGSQEHVQLCYAEFEDYYGEMHYYNLHVFRDGTVFRDYVGNIDEVYEELRNCEMLEDADLLREFFEDKIKKGKESYRHSENRFVYGQVDPRKLKKLFGG